MDEPEPMLRDDEVAGLTPEQRARHERIAGMIRELGEPAPVSDVWQQRVLGAMAKQRAGRRRWIAAAGAVLAAAALVFVLLRRPAANAEPTLVAEVVASDQRHLGDAHDGVAYRQDKLVLRASAAAPAELRVYDERGALLGRCGEQPAPGCTVSGERGARTYRLELVLERLGATRAVLFVGEVAPSSGAMDQDLEAAHGARIVTAPPIKVL